MEMKSHTSDPQSNNQKPSGFNKIMEWKVGVMPLPVYIVLAIIVLIAAYTNQLPTDMIGGFAVIMVLGVLLGDIGQRIPYFNSIGGPAILSLFVPSMLVFFDTLSSTTLEAVDQLMTSDGSNFLYFYIACLVVGSILGMNRTVLIQGFIRMFIPLVTGTIAAVGVGTLVGMLFGYSAHHTFFYIVVPIIAGGIGEGILPLSAGYAGVLGGDASTYISQLVPAAIIGNVCAIIIAGLMKKLGEKRPELAGHDKLVRSNKGDKVLEAAKESSNKAIDFSLMGAGLLVAMSLFVLGRVVEHWIHVVAGFTLSGAIIMIIAATIIKSGNLLPAKLQTGAQQLYKFVSTAFTWPLMVGLGIVFIPLEDVASVFTIGFAVTCASVVIAMATTGYFVGKLMNMYPVEACIVTACHSGLGGTGDVAILSASGRMALMPFAQISTRLGGAATVIGATALMHFFG
ncbi:2-hydroxycarboxylate transporter family protein [Terribacillus saccharophilus]|uniref:Malate permease n=1 Tax=Terribacillus saccharophilus TaxID=361277 RepID=A0A075LMF1_9BACI|nr:MULTISPECIES: 2-hydroxycarboxylate transporter family protein [Terribacillus]AIF67102.1 malate permease [Terribacillus goriensis]MCM3224138.1 2-hydroxycarboxylate transporter family protein [Terribacillus saccharophilus]MEC0281395.1 2-hydroxycarboxylate transporter family protein [Terribacillus saccharophilus]MEC0290901.1 2-hydroxycarboxylate transporter family protein [Terribacillus saccharophilus]MEC0304079.1 2-hydroxycarboxylate transporter family protein [Terribacillus saccharophilus]